MESFENNLKDEVLEESLLKILESNKIKIFSVLNQSNHSKFIKVYVSKLWNMCKMLNYTRNIKDIDSNYYLLRLKDFLCDLFFISFGAGVDFSLNDIFNLILLTTEVGTQWSILNIKMNTEGWIKKIDHLMKFLISKIIDLENLVNLEKKFYTIFVDYLNFYLESFLCPLDEHDEKYQQLIKSLILLKNIRFIDDSSTRILISNILNMMKNFEKNASRNKDVLLNMCQVFNGIRYKNLLNTEMIFDFYKFYIFKLIETNNIEHSENILKNLFEISPSNSYQELEAYFFNLEIILRKSNNSFDKITQLIEIIFDHKEFNLEILEDLIIISSNFKNFDIFLDLFLSKLKINKNSKIYLKDNNNITFNFDFMKKFPILNFCFIYNFFKSKIFYNLTTEIPESANEISINENNPPNFSKKPIFTSLIQEFLKICSECLLENFENSYDEEQTKIIPDLLKNIVLFYLKIEKQSENFSSYFLIEIIKKIKNPSKEKEFIELSLELYIAKNDFIKLKNLMVELEVKNIKNSLVIYSNIVTTIKEGKWNSHNLINTLCNQLNHSEGFNIIYYMKIFSFLLENNVSDFSIINTILLNFSIMFFEKIKSGQVEDIIYVDTSRNKKMGYFNIIYEVIFFYSKNSNFPNQISLFVDFLTFSGNSLKSMLNNENRFLCDDFIIVIEIINLLLNFKNLQKYGSHKSKDEYPEFILIFCSKTIDFVFKNFSQFLEEFFSIDKNLELDQIKAILDLFELYKNLSIFTISYEFHTIVENLDEDDNMKDTKFENYASLLEYFDVYEKNFIYNFSLLRHKFESETEYTNLIDEKLVSLQNSTYTVELIMKIQIMTKINNENNIEDFVLNLVNQYLENKKFIFIVNSIIYQAGFKNLSFKYIKRLLSVLLSSGNDSLNKSYSLNDVIQINRDLINLSETNYVTIALLKEFTSLLSKFNGRIEDFIFSENVEWVLYKLYNFLEGISNEIKVNKNDPEFIMIKQIYEEVIRIQIRNKSFVLTNLIEIIFKKINI